MNVNLHIKKSAKELENITKTAKRALFELRLAESVSDIKLGKFDVFSSGKELLSSVKK